MINFIIKLLSTNSKSDKISNKHAAFRLHTSLIMHKTSPHLDGAYAAFGKVIKSVTVDTFGVKYPEPEKC